MAKLIVRKGLVGDAIDIKAKNSDKTYKKFPVKLPIYNPETGVRANEYRFLASAFPSKKEGSLVVEVGNKVKVRTVSKALVNPDGSFKRMADIGKDPKDQAQAAECYPVVEMTGDQLAADWEVSKKFDYKYINQRAAEKRAAARELVDAPEEVVEPEAEAEVGE